MSDTLAYYPGCSLEGTAKEYDESFRTVCAALDVPIEELPDWNCCGASAAHSTNAFLASALPARNLRLAQELDRDIVAPCVACWSRLRAARREIGLGTEKGQEIARESGVKPDNMPDVVSAPQAILDRVGLDELAGAVKQSLEGLSVVAYYGCLSTRPVEVTEHPEPEDPQELDDICEALGANVKPWSYKTDCCGGSLTLSRPDVVTKLVDNLLAQAEKAGAEAVVTACPMCAQNLEMRRSAGGSRTPVLFFTEAIGYALGLPDTRRWLGRHLVPAVGAIEKATSTGGSSEAGVKQ